MDERANTPPQVAAVEARPVNPNLAAALNLARVGFRIIPQPPGEKHPRMKDWPNKATTDEAVIRDWWRQWPRNQVAVVPPQGVIILDVEGPHGGHAHDGRPALAAWEADRGPIAATWRACTPSGGFHLYLRLPDGVRVAHGNLPDFPGVECVTRKGNAPPGPGRSWAMPPEGDVPPCPDWLVELLPKPKTYLASPTYNRGGSAGGEGPDPVQGEGALRKALRSVETCAAGRNDNLFTLARWIAEVAAGGSLDGDRARQDLEAAALRSGLTPSEIKTALDSGFHPGKVKPRLYAAKPERRHSQSQPTPSPQPGQGARDAVVEAKAATFPAIDPKLPAKEIVVALAKAACHVWKDDSGQTTWADLWPNAPGASRTGPRFTAPVRSETFKHHVVRLFFAWQKATFGKSGGAAPSASALESAFVGLESVAPKGGAAPAMRYAKGPDGELYVDLGDDTGEAVRIGPDGWRIEAAPVVRFRRDGKTGAHPRPERGGSITDLRKFIRAPDDTWPLIVAWMLGAMGKVSMHAVLAIGGPQGSAKSTASTFIRRLVDPTAPKLEMRSPPKDRDELKSIVSASYMLALDNVSGLSTEMADDLCRVATGVGIASRKKYTDSEEHVVTTLAPVLFNGIPDIATRADLADRTLFVCLSPLSDVARKAPPRLDAAFDAARPRILGALFDALACGLRNYEATERLWEAREKPRMVEAAYLAEAASEVTGLPPGAVVAAMLQSRAESEGRILDADPVAAGAERLLSQKQGTYRASLADLYAEMKRALYGDGRPGDDFPKSSRALRGHLKRIAVLLARRGIVYLAAGDPGNSRRDARLEMLRLTTEPGEPQGFQEETNPWPPGRPGAPAPEPEGMDAPDAPCEALDGEPVTSVAPIAFPLAAAPAPEPMLTDPPGPEPEGPDLAPNAPVVAPAAVAVAPASPIAVDAPFRASQTPDARLNDRECFALRRDAPPIAEWTRTEQARLDELCNHSEGLPDQKRGIYKAPKRYYREWLAIGNSLQWVEHRRGD